MGIFAVAWLAMKRTDVRRDEGRTVRGERSTQTRDVRPWTGHDVRMYVASCFNAHARGPNHRGLVYSKTYGRTPRQVSMHSVGLSATVNHLAHRRTDVRRDVVQTLRDRQTLETSHRMNVMDVGDMYDSQRLTHQA